ncbi:MAG: acyl esterase [Oleispira sp.]|nr:acyl esterase [Oleispira sp.]
MKLNERKFNKLIASTVLTTAFTISALTSPASAQADDNFIPILSFAAAIFNQGVFPQSDNYTIDDDISVIAEDGVNIDGNIFVPNNLSGPAPAIIFISSWALNEYEYLQQAGQLADQGYIVLSYAPRGFGTSGGLVDTAGPKDIADLSNVIDFLIENYPVDENAIGAGGISYGAGISVIGAAKDPRIKAVSAMSGWGSLKDSLYGNQTPRLVWATILDLSGQLLGRLDPIVSEYVEILIDQDLERQQEVFDWAEIRSPNSYIDELNANGTAIYFGKAYGDNLFQPNSVMDMFSQLEVPKYMDIMPGTHATAELLPPLLGLGDNRMWENTFKWFDLHLKGEVNDLVGAKPLNMKIKFQDRYESFDDYPVAEASPETFYLHPRSVFDDGDLETSPFRSWFAFDNTINGWKGSLFTTAIPLISPLLEQLEVPTVTNIKLADQFTSIYFNTGRLDETMKIRGTANVSLQIQPKYKTVQLVAYLYDEDALGNAILITHGVITLPVAEKGKKITVDFDLVTIAYDVPKGHKVTLAIDTKDLQYKSPTKKAFFVDFEFSNNSQSTLTIPTL